MQKYKQSERNRSSDIRKNRSTTITSLALSYKNLQKRNNSSLKKKEKLLTKLKDFSLSATSEIL